MDRTASRDTGPSVLRGLLEQVAAGETTPAEAMRILASMPDAALSSAERALARGELEDARLLFQRALDNARMVGDRDLYADACLGLGKALNAVDGKSGSDLLCDAFELFLESGNHGKARAAALVQGGFPYNSRHLSMLNRAAELPSPDRAQQALMLSRQAIVQAVVTGDREKSVPLLESALELAEGEKDRGTLALAWTRQATLAFGDLRFAEAMEHAIIAVSHALVQEDPQLVCTASEVASRTALVLGHAGSADHYIRIFTGASDSLNWPGTHFSSRYLSAQLALAQGRFTGAREHLAAITAHTGINMAQKRTARSLDALLAAETGDDELAVREIDAVFEEVMSEGRRPNIDLALMLRGHTAALGIGGPSKAAAMGVHTRSWMEPELPAAMSDTAVWADVTYAHSTHDRKLAEASLAAEKGTLDGMVTGARLWCSHHYRALGMASAGRWTDAALQFETAFDVYRRSGFMAPFAWAAAHYAEMSAESGRRGLLRRASTVLAEGESVARELGMVKAGRRISEARTSLGLRGRNRTGLTDRELDVLRLMVSGLTNAQIAERLFISPNTVASHIKSIYTSLDVSNRAEAVMAAANLPGSDHRR